LLCASTSCCLKSTLLMTVLLKSTPVFALAASWTPSGSEVLKPQTHFTRFLIDCDAKLLSPSAEGAIAACTPAVHYTRAGDWSTHTLFSQVTWDIMFLQTKQCMSTQMSFSCPTSLGNKPIWRPCISQMWKVKCSNSRKLHVDVRNNRSCSVPLCQDVHIHVLVSFYCLFESKIYFFPLSNPLPHRGTLSLSYPQN